MKKILLLAFIFAAFSANAQITSGNIFIGGTLGVTTAGSSSTNINGATTSTTKGNSTLGFNIGPSVGLMLTENIAAGISLDYSLNHTLMPDFFDNGTQTFDQKQNISTYTFSPFARYFYGVNDNLYLFAQMSIPLQYRNTEMLMWNSNFDGVEKNDGKLNTMQIGLNSHVGASYFITTNIALETVFNLFNVNYQIVKTSNLNANGGGNVTTTPSLNVKFNTSNLINLGGITIGIKFFIK